MKKIFGFIVVLLVLFVVWFMYLKQYDYNAKIKVNANIGTINQTIKAWNNTLENAEIIDQIKLGELSQDIVIIDSIFRYNWELVKKTDTTSQINIFVKLQNDDVFSRAKRLINGKELKQRNKKLILDFNDFLNSHLEAIKIKIEGETTIPEKYCAYIEIKCKQSDKAKGMMQEYPLLTSIFGASSHIKLDGDPFVEITYWDIQNDSINYNFCYPIIKNDSLPEHNILKYKKIAERKAIKAIYNGNYITSDRAWYALLDYAKTRNIPVIKKPVEIFYNNPNLGGDERNWKTEVFMPIKK